MIGIREGLDIDGDREDDDFAGTCLGLREGARFGRDVDGEAVGFEVVGLVDGRDGRDVVGTFDGPFDGRE